MGIKVTGIGMYVPELVITNDDLARMVDKSDEWVTKRTGIKRRRISNGELAYQMGAKAAKQAIHEAGVSMDEIDLIIATTMSPDCSTPSLACLIGYELNNHHAAAFDINGACSGFVYAMDIARNFLETGTYRNILLVSSEVMSRMIDFSDRSTCVLFGDGAGAVVLTKQEGLYSSYLSGNPSGAFKLFTKMQYQQSPWDKQPKDYGLEHVNQYPDGYLYMEGEEIYKFATKALPEAVNSSLERAGLSIEDLDILVPHQANVRILEAANKRLKLPKEKMYVGIQEYGNISSACIPIALCHLKANHQLNAGHKVCLAGFGAGLTYGALVFEW